MENEGVEKVWKSQPMDLPIPPVENILFKAKKQRGGQLISIAIMFLTTITLVVYTFYFAFKDWNSFNTGLTLMIFSLVSRILLEWYSLFRKEHQLISLNPKAYHKYLKGYYRTRVLTNYWITPICVIAYTSGFYLLLPYFKTYLSSGFYTYILISGIVSLMVISTIIISSTIKEQRFLNLLKEQ